MENEYKILEEYLQPIRRKQIDLIFHIILFFCSTEKNILNCSHVDKRRKIYLPED